MEAKITAGHKDLQDLGIDVALCNGKVLILNQKEHKSGTLYECQSIDSGEKFYIPIEYVLIDTTEKTINFPSDKLNQR